MKKSELKNALFAELSILLKPFDFTLVRRMDWFKRKEDSTSLMYRLDFYTAEPGYTVSPSVAVRLKEVEKIFHMVSDFEPKYQKSNPTIWVTIDDLVKSKSKCEYDLKSHDDVDSVVEVLFDIFKSTALPFLENNSSLNAIDKLLNNEPNKDSIYDNFYSRFYHGAIVAKLNNRSNYQQIAETYRQSLSSFHDAYYLAGFEKLLSILDRL